MIRARGLTCPRVVEIDASEATEIARRGVLPIDDTTIAELARQCGVSKRTAANTIKAMLREAAT